MKKKGMKRALVLALTVALAEGVAFTSYASYESNSNYSQGNGIDSLKAAIDREREYVEVTLPAKMEELETVTIPALEEEIAIKQEAHEKDLEENPHSVDTRLKVELDIAKSRLEKYKKELSDMSSELETRKSGLERMEKELEQRTNLAYGDYWGDGYYSPDDINNSESSDSYSLTQKFWIENHSGNYILLGKYRGWQKLMGGSWEYDSAVTPSLDISFYEDGECLESSLSRADSYDTETLLAWSLPDGLSSSHNYVIEINGQRFRVNMSGSHSSSASNDSFNDSYSDVSTDFDDTSETESVEESTSTTNTATTVDYSGFYDANLADGIPNEVYYAQSTDGGFTVSLDMNFAEYSTYDKSNKRGQSDLVKGWLCKDGKWYAFNSLGYQVTGWIPVGGYWYCVYPGTDAESCYMLTGWQELNSHWYYFNTSGQMVVNSVVDGYVLGSDGIWVQ